MVSFRRHVLVAPLLLSSAALAAGACSTTPEESTEDLAAARQALDPVCVTLRRGQAGDVGDTFLSGDYPTWAPATDPGVWTGVSSGGNFNRALYSFDLSPVPAGATVTSATFSVYESWSASYNQIGVHRVTGPWTEATATLAGFNLSFIETMPELTFAAGGVGFRTVDLTPLVQEWVSGQTPNHGVALIEPPVNRHYFFTSEISTVERRPSLTICYTEGACDDGVQGPGEVGVDCGGPCPACECTPDSTAPCYTGPAGTEGVGACAAGTRTCDADGSGYGECTGQVLPAAESCATAADDDCDGEANEGCVCVPGSNAPCYTGPAGTAGVGACAAGLMTCNADGTAYGQCVGEVLPAAESCATAADDDCDGQTNEGCVCTPGALDYCYTGPAGTLGVGQCTAGLRMCNADGSAWGACAGQVLPATESCATAADDDCDGQTNEGCVCVPFATESCYSGPAGTAGVGICKAGTRTCNSAGTAWGSCTGQVLPAAESCANGTDDDCDGTVNENCAAATCALYTENFDDGTATEITSGAYKIGWCDTYIPNSSNSPLCMAGGQTLRTNDSTIDPTIWVSRGAAPCTSAKITYSYYQFASASATLQYQRSNDTTEVCEKTGTFTNLLTHPTLQACVSQSSTVTFNGQSSIYFRFEHPSGNTNAIWLDNISVELQGCSCN